MKPRIYLETTVISYLTARASRDVVTAARQHITREWWENRREEFDLYVSDIVTGEAGGGNGEATERRLAVVKEIQLVDITEEAYTLADKLVSEVPLPDTAGIDALHIAAATANGLEYLLTWNCRHIANATLRSRIEEVCRRNGYEPPTICTPEEFMEE